MKKLFGVLAFLSFFWLLGVVGAIEQDMMALGIGGRSTWLLRWPVSMCSVSCPAHLTPFPAKEKAALGVQTERRQA